MPGQGVWVMVLLPVDSTSENLFAAILRQRSGEDRSVYLESFDPDGHDGFGSWELTTDIARAKRFGDTLDVLEEWKRQSTVRPLRDDGKPNRPLTMFTCNPQWIPQP